MHTITARIVRTIRSPLILQSDDTEMIRGWHEFGSIVETATEVQLVR